MKKPNPPKWADRFLKKVCPEEYLEEIQGDLHEAFYWRVESKGLTYATRTFCFDALKTVRLCKLKTPGFMENIYLATLQHYLRTGIRFIWKTRTYSIINILGLAVGISTAALAYLFLVEHHSYDTFHRKADQLYRLTSSMEYQGKVYKFGGASYVMGEELPKQVPGIEKATHIKNGLALRKIGEEYEYQYFHYADRELFDMLDFTFLSGGPGSFENPSQILVSESFADQLSQTDELTLLFGSEELTFTIIGIYKDMPRNSTIRPDILIPFTFWVNRVETRRTVEWFDINMNVFILKKKGASEEEIIQGMNEVLYRNAESENSEKLELQAFTDMHTSETYSLGNGLRATADQQILSAVLGIAILCLLIACFNYSNFALGNFLSRSREVAIRKVIGAKKSAIFQQFLSESLLSTIIAGACAIMLIYLALPTFSQFVNETYTAHQLASWTFIIGFMITLIISTILSGLYPAFVLSTKKASLALKNKLKVGGKSLVSWFLVMLQVGLTTFLINGMITVGRQLDHLLNFDLGYNDENILTVEILDDDEQKLTQLKNSLGKLPIVQSVSAHSGYNGTNINHDTLKLETSHLRVDEDFVDLVELEIMQGRNFDLQKATDAQNAILVNETFVSQVGLQNPVGKRIPFKYGELENPRIIGVVKDYRYFSPKTALEPLVIYTSPQYQIQELMIKFYPAMANAAPHIAQIEELWRENYPQWPFRYAWLSEINEAEMQTELQMQKLTSAGSLIAILLASLGLLGVAGTHVRQRLKEVSIRKINGATPYQIYWLFSKKFGQWLLLGFIIGTIPAIYFLQNWLQNYPERINLHIGIPIMGILLCSFVFILINTWLLYKVIYVNPVVHLRDE